VFPRGEVHEIKLLAAKVRTTLSDNHTSSNPNQQLISFCIHQIYDTDGDREGLSKMATVDVKDILGIANEGPRAPAPKSKKKALVEHGPRLKGMQREARALQGDSVPPVTLTEAPRYKERPNLPQLPVRHWEQRPFVHGARSDGLTLKHWKRANTGFAPRHLPMVNGEDTEMLEDTISSAPRHDHEFSEENHFAKYDVQVPVPAYTTEQYEGKLKAEGWTKEETDYFLELCRDFGLRWIVIADRYDVLAIPPAKENIEPPADTDAMVVDGTEVSQKISYPHRKMEDLKARYYQVAAKMLEAQIPATNMTQVEFQLWEKMRNFDAKSESTRKDLAEKLFERTKDEAEEEKVLLEELKRITMNEEEFLKMRRDLYSRLEPPPTKRNNGEEQSTAMYQTSSGLSVLLQNLLAKEKRLKRPSVMPNGEGTPSSATDVGSQKWEKGRHPNQYSRRDTLDSNDGAATGPQKKSSQSQPNTRTLAPAEELKFGVSYPQERLTSGVAFRHEKATKVLQAKSSVQAQKISNALTELGIPARLGMPTERVCREFERLVQAIHLLLDTRKGVEKVSMEVRVLEEARRIRLGLPKEGGEGQETSGNAMQVDGEGPTPKAAANLEAGMEVDDSQIGVAEKEQNGDDEDNEEESKLEQEEDENEEDTQNPEDEEDNVEAEENASDAGADDSEAEQVQPSRKRRHEDSSQVSDAEEDEETALGQDQDDDNEEQQDEDVDAEVDEAEIEDDADSNADLGSQNDVSDEEEQEQSNEEDDADEDEVDQEEDAEAEAEADAEIEESEVLDSASVRPGSAQSVVSRLKRSASVVSEVSRAGSNRSGVGRKKRR
jgi:DNA methyltransferase 1-associated protein 1